MAVSTVVADAAVDGLKKGLRGELIRPDEPGYDEARKVWNGMIDKRPALIVRCAGVGDVIDAVNFRPRQRSSARGARRQPQCRGSGHLRQRTRY
jgi:hypothetical protein